MNLDFAKRQLSRVNQARVRKNPNAAPPLRAFAVYDVHLKTMVLAEARYATETIRLRRLPENARLVEVR